MRHRRAVGGGYVGGPTSRRVAGVLGGLAVADLIDARVFIPGKLRPQILNVSKIVAGLFDRI